MASETTHEAYTTINIDNDQYIEPALDSIPSALLSEISSFLVFKDKIRFEQTSSSIFFGVRYSKLPLYSLSGDNFLKLAKYCARHQDKSISSITRFKSVTFNTMHWYLSFNFKFPELFNRITNLEITGDGYELNCILLHLFEGTKSPNLKMFRLIPDYDIWYEDNQDAFELGSLLYLEQLAFIEITGHFDTPGYTDNHYCKWVSTLKGLAINNHRKSDEDFDNLMRNICQSFGNDLQSFHKSESQIPNEINGKLENLKELCISLWNNTMNNDIKVLLNQNMNKLERIYFRAVDLFELLQSTINNGKESMKLLLHKMIKNVNYIGYNANSITKHRVVLMELDILIESLKNIKKHTLKIRIDELNLFSPGNIDKITEKLETLINILNANCSHWMLIGCNWQLYNRSLLNLFQSTKERCNTKYSSKAVGHWSNINFVIKSKQCMINGYHERWIMECEFCRQKNLFD